MLQWKPIVAVPCKWDLGVYVFWYEMKINENILNELLNENIFLFYV